MEYQCARICTSFIGPPTFGPVLITGQRRALLGWNHSKDTPEGLLTGSVWCWVSDGGLPKFQVFDTSGNRSPRPGVVVDCGVANFTMVRMFHPYWCPYGRIPKDMDKKDKAMCRHRYRALVLRHQLENRLAISEEGEGDAIVMEPPTETPNESPRSPIVVSKGNAVQATAAQAAIKVDPATTDTIVIDDDNGDGDEESDALSIRGAGNGESGSGSSSATSESGSRFSPLFVD